MTMRYWAVWIPCILFASLLLDRIAGELPGKLHPVSWMGSYIWAFDRKSLGRSHTGEFLYGLCFTVSGMILFSAPLLLLRFVSVPLFLILSVLLFKQTFSVRFLFKAGREVQVALASGNIEDARRLVSYHLVSRDTRTLSESEVASSVIESLSENLTDSVVSPFFYFCLFGLPGAWAYRFINTADAMIGYHDSKHEYRGKFAARLDDVLNYIPARLTMLFISFSALLCGESSRNALRSAVTIGHETESPNAGLTMGAMALALGITLTKRGHYVLSGGPDVPDIETIGRAFRVAKVSVLCAFLFYSLIAGAVYALIA